MHNNMPSEWSVRDDDNDGDDDVVFSDKSSVTSKNKHISCR